MLQPSIVKAKELAASRGTGLWRMQLQLLKYLGDRVKANGVERLDGGGSLCQLFLRRDDEVRIPKAHVHARDTADAVGSHPRPSVDVETCKMPLPGVPTVSVLSYHR